MAVLPDIDPNPSNFVSAGIVSTTTVLVGCLLRLEPNLDIKVCAASYCDTPPFLVCRFSCNFFCLYSVVLHTVNSFICCLVPSVTFLILVLV